MSIPLPRFMSPSLRLIGLAALLSCSVLLGCGKERAECSALAAKINTGTERLSAFDAERKDRRSLGAKTTAQEMRKLADIYTELAADIGSLAVSSHDLKLYAERYQAALRRTGDSARTLATALDNNQRTEAATADGIFSAALTEQQTTIELINKQCGAR